MFEIGMLLNGSESPINSTTCALHFHSPRSVSLIHIYACAFSRPQLVRRTRILPPPPPGWHTPRGVTKVNFSCRKSKTKTKEPFKIPKAKIEDFFIVFSCQIYLNLKNFGNFRRIFVFAESKNFYTLGTHKPKTQRRRAIKIG